MTNYNFAPQFRKHFEAAVSRFKAGARGADKFCTEEEKKFLNENGLTPQNLYDYAEDQTNYGEPGFETALSIELVRRDYFRNMQASRHSVSTLDESSLPGKSAEMHGISWLPRILPKARAKLRGELPASLMFCCGGDRKFFQEHDIQPSEFLRVIWKYEDNLNAVADWMVSQKGGK